MPYPAELADLLVDELALDGRGRLLDLGCGPGSLTLPLAPYFEQTVAVDADEQMLAEGARLAQAAGITNVSWVCSRAEDVSRSLGDFRMATMAQSFHWMDRDRVAGLLRQLLIPGGALAFVHATTHQGIEGTDRVPHPRPPWEQIEALVADYLGQERRAGRGYRQIDSVTEDERGQVEARIFGRAGFAGPKRLEVPGWVVTRSADEIVASVFSLSFAAPHLFGDRVGSFEHELRILLTQASPTGRFSEAMREIAADLWTAD
ncbi:class I SAM-dependent methyltransferase [Nocardioides sp. HM23]|uniref:class I SAM-dependent methyltransferase n=1 Tax=Nocardioides bizhenqiangii TaxID=3095076 RepID=UPI002ACA7A3C|nr:class I SAM-dependent methyltransferase [Nocardioides sp. HM23]MDZ5619392.1 class I SAM-dependent methyltransferase [Nocardioides sp. HM23]